MPAYQVKSLFHRLTGQGFPQTAFLGSEASRQHGPCKSLQSEAPRKQDKPGETNPSLAGSRALEPQSAAALYVLRLLLEQALQEPTCFRNIGQMSSAKLAYPIGGKPGGENDRDSEGDKIFLGV